MNVMKKQIIDLFSNTKKTLEGGSWFSGYKNKGEYKIWLKNGQIEFHCFYKNGERDGKYKIWWGNGKLRTHCFYKNRKEYTIEDAKKKFPEGPWLE